MTAGLDPICGHTEEHHCYECDRETSWTVGVEWSTCRYCGTERDTVFTRECRVIVAEMQDENETRQIPNLVGMEGTDRVIGQAIKDAVTRHTISDYGRLQFRLEIDARFVGHVGESD